MVLYLPMKIFLEIPCQILYPWINGICFWEWRWLYDRVCFLHGVQLRPARAHELCGKPQMKKEGRLFIVVPLCVHFTQSTLSSLYFSITAETFPAHFGFSSATNAAISFFRRLLVAQQVFRYRYFCVHLIREISAHNLNLLYSFNASSSSFSLFILSVMEKGNKFSSFFSKSNSFVHQRPPLILSNHSLPNPFLTISAVLFAWLCNTDSGLLQIFTLSPTVKDISIIFFLAFWNNFCLTN